MRESPAPSCPSAPDFAAAAMASKMYLQRNSVVVSTPANLCAQIVAPYPPAGRIAVASQSGNFVSSFLNYARQTGVGISRAVSAGNADLANSDALQVAQLADPEGARTLGAARGAFEICFVPDVLQFVCRSALLCLSSAMQS